MLTCRSKYYRMSFNVTQCPACESTFNTNSRVLAAAAGKVRCGACLNVFEAIDHFLIPEETDEASHQDESVFVGNDPQEFFDPSSFLTRSALRETQEDESLLDEPVDEQNLHQELGQSETVNEDFFASVVEELQGRGDTPEPSSESEPIEELPPNQAEELIFVAGTEEIDGEFENEIVDSFTAQAEETPQPAAEEISTFETEIVREIEAAPPAATTPPAEDKDSFLGTGISASFSFDPRAPREERSNAAKQDSPSGQQETGEQSPESSAAGVSEAESPVAGTASAEVLADEEAQTAQQEPLTPDAEERVESGSAMSAASPQDQTTPAAEVAEIIDEPDSIAEPSETPEPIAAHIGEEEEPDLEAESFSHETSDAEASGEHEAAEVESADAEDEQAIENPNPSPSETEETEEESTEAIRARALEAELSDEDALEAIPRENLAALGSMSTPVELLARRESHLLRSSLLFLSILLLGGLLSAQYLWQRMELYSQLPQLRPLYEVACGYLDCELPVYTDIDSIRSENLTVQTHPTFANGLMVNTVIRNTAAFEQPFPILILSFNSAENNVIALREFTAAEYLDPGLRSVRSMPALTPVQIGLAIMDPGPEAVNYTLAFRWP